MTVIMVYIKKKRWLVLHQKSTQDGHPRVMKTEQPISRQPANAPKASLAEEHMNGSARTVSSQGLRQPKDAAVFLSFVFGQYEESREDAARKWSRAGTLRFALISCGLFWLIVATGVWAYLHVR